MSKLCGHSSKVEQQTDLFADSGSIPTCPLQLLRVNQCEPGAIQAFIEQWHYSRSVFGITQSHCFGVLAGHALVGAAIFGPPAAFNVSAKYGADGLVELRRFCMIDDLPKNSESRSLGVMFRLLSKNGVKRVLSYADPTHGHTGTIYRATGFEYLGLTAKRNHILWRGQIYPDRNLHQVHFPYHLELREALKTGQAGRVEVPGKHIYLKELRG